MPIHKTLVAAMMVFLIACSGEDGAVGPAGPAGPAGGTGATGEPGVASLVRLSSEPAGSYCTFGGVKVDSGPDENGNGVLDAGEETGTEYVCNSEDVLVSVTEVLPGAECAGGGLRIDAGPDRNGNGELDAGEVTSTELVCTPAPGDFDGPLFVADKQIDGVEHIYRSGSAGGEPIQLDDVSAITAKITDVALSPDRRWVAYRADADTDEVFELYGIDLVRGGPAVKLSGAMVDGGDVQQATIKWAPDSSRVAYLADQTTDGEVELFATDLIRGNGNQRVSPSNLADFADVQSDYRWSPTSGSIAYRLDRDNNNEFHVFVASSSSFGSSGGVQVSGPLVAGGSVQEFRWAPDSSRLAYRANQEIDGVTELFVGNRCCHQDNTKVSGAMVSGGNVQRIYWAPDGLRIAYLADQETDNLRELFTVEANGDNGAKVSGAMAPGGGIDGSSAVAWAPDSSRIAYAARQDSSGVPEVYTSAPDSAVGNLRVSGPMPAGGGFDDDLTWAPDSSRVAYLAYEPTTETTELFTALATVADSAVRLHPDLVTDPGGGGGETDPGHVSRYAWAPDSSRVVYVAVQDVLGIFELYSSTPEGAANNVKVSGTMAAEIAGSSGGLRDFAWSPDGSRLAYAAEQDEEQVMELYVTAPDSAASIVKLSGVLTERGDVQLILW